jgi:hypothetical protein
MANPYLKRGSSNKGSKNKSTGSKNEREGFFKKFWTKHKAIIIGASVAVISIPVGVTVWRKMQAKKTLELPDLNAGSDNQMLGTSDDLMMDAMLQTTEAPSKKAEEIFPVATEQIDLTAANKELEMPEIPDNPRANISFSASDFE